MERLSHGTAATATAVAENPPSNVVEFRPRPSNLAHAWLASAPVSPRAKRIGRALAAHVRIATEDVDWRHIRAGDVAAFVTADTLATDTGDCTRTVKRGLAELVRAGLVKRRTLRTNTYVFPAPAAPPAVTPGVTPGVTLEQGYREQPRREPREEPAAPVSRGAVDRPKRPDPTRATKGEVEFAIRLLAEHGKLPTPADADAYREKAAAVEDSGYRIASVIGRLKRGEHVRVFTAERDGLKPPPHGKRQATAAGGVS